MINYMFILDGSLAKSLLEMPLAADIVVRAGTLSLLPTPLFHKGRPEVVRVWVRPEHEVMRWTRARITVAGSDVRYHSGNIFKIWH